MGAPKFRMYDNALDTFASEVALADTASNIRDVRLKCSPTIAKCVIVSLSADGTLNSFTCTSLCGMASSWTQGSDFADIWSAEPVTTDRPFDMAFEKTSGDLIIVYDKVSTTSGQEVFTRTMTSAGTTFGSETAVNTQTADSVTDRVYPFIRLAMNLTGGDKIGAVMFDTSNDDVNAMIWDGSAWGNNAAVTTASAAIDEEQIGIAFERNSGHLLVVGGAGVEVGYREFTTSWQTAGSVGGVATGVGTINWISMKPTPRSAGNEIYLGFTGDLDDFATIQWSGTAWGTGTEHDAAVDGNAARVFDIAMSPAADGDGATVDALLMWGTASNSISYRSWSATNTYGTASTISNSGTHPWISFPAQPNPTSADTIDSLGGTLDSAFDISRLEWTGGANAPTDLDDEVTIDTVVTTWEAMNLDWFYVTFTSTTSISDTGTFSESAVKSMTKPISDTSTWTETRTSGFTKPISDTATFTESRRSVFTKIIGDTSTWTEARRSGLTKAISDTATFTESRISALTKVISDTSSWTESMLVGLLFTANLADTSTFTESRVGSIIKSLSDTSTFTESMTRGLSKFLSDTSTWTEARAVALVKTFSDTSILTENLSSGLGYIVNIADTMVFTESRTSAITKLMTDTVTFSEAMSREIIKGIVETASFTETLLTDLLGLPVEAPPDTSSDRGTRPPSDRPSLFEVGPNDAASTALVHPSLITNVMIPPALAVAAGDEAKFDIVIRWSGDDHIRIQEISFSEHSDWFTVEQPLPAVARVPAVSDLHSSGTKLEVKIPVTVHVPADVTDVSDVVEAIVVTSSNPDTSLNVRSHVAQIRLLYITEPIMDWMLMALLMVIGVGVTYAATTKFKRR